MTIAPTRYSAPDPYVGFDGPDHAGAPASAGASRRRPTDPAPEHDGIPPWGTPLGTDPAAAAKSVKATKAATSAPAKPASPPITSSPGRPGRHATFGPSGGPARGKGALVVLVIGVALVVVGLVVGGAVRVLSGADSGSDGRGGGNDLEVLWSLESSAVSDDWGGFGSVDGTIPGTVLSTSAGWVTILEPSTVEAALASVDPDSGQLWWTTDLPEARCTQTEAGVDLVCLTRDGPGSAFQIVSVDVETGEVVGDPAPTTLTHVPVLVVPLGESLLTLSTTGELSAVDLDGTVRWSEPLLLDDLDTSYLQADVAFFDSATLLTFGWSTGTVHATLDGFTTHPCEKLAATAEAWVCMDSDGGDATARTPDGEMLWSAEWSEYYLVDKYQRIAPVVIADNWDGTISAVDPLTGARGVPIEVGDGQDNLGFLGDADHPVVTTDDGVALLDADLTTVLWQTSISDEYLSIAGGGLVGEAIVVDSEGSYGFDVGTGELLWERGFVPYDAWVLDDAFITQGSTQLTRFDV